LLLSLDQIYKWTRARGYPDQDEHIIIAGIPVHVIPAHDALAVEAVKEAADLEYDEQSVRVIRPEYLIAMYLEESARTRKRLERVAGCWTKAIWTKACSKTCWIGISCSYLSDDHESPT